MLALRTAQKRDVDVLGSERESEDVVEGLRAVPRLRGEPLEAALERLDGGTGRDVAKEVPPKHAILRQAGQP